ncbi:hypothetical protein KFE25_002756 [Diacronema lutheri]|uniref:Uncharacterized protein n=1 Tax=Diacronema lutheri TaxID=2081491 RepID=A0A8J5XLL5_DIALT|nr:hypothetical protein KFE25_002756 [Diacronema lutheri]
MVPSATWLAREPAPPYTTDGKMRTGLRAIAYPWDEWIIAPPTALTLTLKSELLSGLRAHECSVSDDTRATRSAEAEVAGLIDAYLRLHTPHVTGAAAVAATGDRLVDAARRVEEDLVLLRAQGDGTFALAAATVTFSFGAVREKLGASLERIHAPVPHYAHTVGRAVDRALGRLDAEKGFARSNWELRRTGDLAHPSLLEPGRRGQLDPPADGAATPPSSLWLRVEHQTLRRLPECAQFVLFTVRTLTDPLSALAHVPEAATALSARIASLSEQMALYKGLADAAERRRICAFLDDIAAAAGSQGSGRSS